MAELTSRAVAGRGTKRSGKGSYNRETSSKFSRKTPGSRTVRKEAKVHY